MLCRPHISGWRFTADRVGTGRVVLSAAASLLLLAMAMVPATSGTRAVSGSPATPGTAAAPGWCIAGVCLGATENEILQRFGAGRPFPGEAPLERCYQARGKSIYVTALLDQEDPAKSVNAVLLSGEMTCPEIGPARFAPDRAGCRGLRLFDPVNALQSLGATERSPRDTGFPWRGAPPEVRQYDYRCEPDQACGVMASAFARQGTIVAVSIWRSACKS